MLCSSHRTLNLLWRIRQSCSGFSISSSMIPSCFHTQQESMASFSKMVHLHSLVHWIQSSQYPVSWSQDQFQGYWEVLICLQWTTTTAVVSRMAFTAKKWSAVDLQQRITMAAATVTCYACSGLERTSVSLQSIQNCTNLHSNLHIEP